ncbi:hypothetical protein BX600DRAFT_508000 [Xylariales sp. PMI_506]|nr:hypothetical protein BX600DRAFT_508000 [Xylariales sp. PMI_506]
MRVSSRLLATAAAPTNNGLRQALTLLPPIPLYRRLFRAHRNHLPHEMRVLGDEYIKAEFRAHQKVDNPVHLIGFLTEWQLYAQEIEGDAWKGGKLDRGKIEKLSTEQMGQLYELMKAIQKRHEDGGNDEEAL